jgi:hypothetical protein
MSYNDGGCCSGSGWNMPFVFPFPGTNSNGWGNGNDMFGMLMMLLFFSLFGFGGYGGARGGMPMPFGGMMPCANSGGNIAAEAAAYVGAQNTADKVSGIATGVDAIAGIATANGVKIETVKDQNNAGFSNLNTHLCEGFHSVSQQFNEQTMQGMNMHNATTALLNDMRAEQAKCCCESKTLAQAIASQAQYQAETNKGEILRAIDALGCRFDSRIDGLERAALQDKLAAANERNAELKAKLDNQNQTAQLAALIQANGCNKHACAPCGPAYPYWFCNPCVDGIQRAVNDALGTRIGEILFPSSSTTPTTT